MSSRLRTRLRAGTGLSTPSLSLEFQTATGALDPRITFSRTSQATLVDSTGKLTYAPNNLLVNSEDFEAAAWTKDGSTVTTNSFMAPNGTMTADTITGASGNCRAYQLATIVTGVKYMMSVYVKAGTATSITFSFVNVFAGPTFTFSTKSWSVVGGWTTGYEELANGWFRIWGSYTSTTTFAGPGFAVNAVGATAYYWGAQMEAITYQTTPGTYNSTSPKNLLGYTQEFDNAAWTKSNAFVQTNLLTYSEAFDNAAWTKGFTTVTANAVVAPNGSLSADKIVETTDVSVTHFVQGGSAVTSGVQYTISCYARSAGEGRRLTFGGAGIGAANEYPIFDLDTGTVDIAGTTTVVKSATITSVGGGWYRCVAVVTAGGTAAIQYILTTATTDNSAAAQAYTGNGTSGLYLWGAQLVQGSTAGDYQRTDAAAAAVQYVAPDGSRTADKLVANTTAAVHCIQQNATTAAPVAVSFYAKAAEYANAAIGSNANNYVYFDLTNGVVSSTLGTGWSSATITAVGNGWYRCAAFTSVSNTRYDIFAVNAVGTNGNTAPSYTGDGTSGIYIWGAQLSNSASLDPYVYNPVAAPTSAAYYGPRFDYDPVTLANKGLLIEEQRTNLLTNSENFAGSGWVIGTGYNSTITQNTTIAPDGTTTADAIVADNGGGTGNVILARTVSITNGTSYTVSFFAKAGTLSWMRLHMLGYTSPANGGAYFNLGAGTIGTVDSGYTATITPFGSGWYRCTISFTAGATASGEMRLTLANANGDTAVARNGTSSVIAWGAQLEAGSFATSYIPTVASQVTRTADAASMQGANFSNWYNPNGGTIVVSASQPTIFASSRSTTSISLPSANVPRITTYRQSAGGVNFYAVNSAVVGNAINSGVTATAGVIHKTAASYNATSQQTMSVNGSVVAVMNVDMAGDLGRLNSLSIGSDFIGSTNSIWCGHIQGIAYYPTVLANAQLQSLTAQSTIPSLSLDFTTQVFNVG